MKYLTTSILFLLGFALSAQNTATFPAAGHCSNCKAKIEKAAKGLDGVQSAVWNLDDKKVTVEYNQEMVSLDDIKRAIADVGYDTDTFKATGESHAGSGSCNDASASEKTMVMPEGTSVSFSVSGNCGGCKNRIEKAANSVEGVKAANWDSEAQLLTVVYNPENTKLKQVKKAVAAVGHDTDQVNAKKKIYAELPGCCQYERVL
jgi:copper ion binding protein